MPTQLRLYTINRDCLEQFAAEWKANVLPLRRAHGFTIRHAWTIARSNQFAWFISYDGPENWEARESAYYDSRERREMHPNPARLIARIEEYVIADIL
ncbi:MAG: hypothetical protein ACU0C9_07870 [Paracoccaceae bacterium]